ncbi:MAG: circadian clock protein KaiC [Janthinobacterium lividum]
MHRATEQAAPADALPKCPTGIAGFDALTLGGLPRGRPSLVCGRAGCGKTLFAMTFLVHGATVFGEPGVFMSFEETGEDLAQNVASLGYDLPALVASGRLVMDHVRVERSEIEETGEYDLEGLFIRLGHAIRTVGARRVVLDTLEALFAGLDNTALLRAELRRLFGWLKEQGVTAIITAERGEGSLTRHGLEEYVSDCVVLLDNPLSAGITTRRLRVVKYRGSAHDANEYPFLIDAEGISVLPVTAAVLEHDTSDATVSSGVAGLDAMLGAGGFFRGSSVLISGEAGTGKTSIACHFADAACRRGERCLYFAYEESPQQITRNMRSIGLDLAPWVEADLLRFHAARPTLYGLEMHLARMHREIDSFRPDAVIVDPVSSLRGEATDVYATMLRMIDLLKSRGITAVTTNLIPGGAPADRTEQGMSSLMDTWLSVVNLESNGERNRALYVLKSRGMSHSNLVREFQMTDHGVRLIPAYLGANGVLTGSARLARENQDREDARGRDLAADQRSRELAQRRAALERQIDELRATLHAQDEELGQIARLEAERHATREAEQRGMAALRGAGGHAR